MIRNKKTGQMYIGQSKDIEKRFKKHCRMTDIDKAIVLEGKDNFDFIILEEVDESLLKERENYWINYYNTYKDDKHYNNCDGESDCMSSQWGHNHPRSKYTLWNITYSNYNKQKIKDNQQKLYKPFYCKYKGYRLNIGLFHDFVSCEIINQLIEEAIK